MQQFKVGKAQILLMSFCILFLLFSYIFYKSSPKPIDLNLYETLLSSNQIESAKVSNDKLIIYTENGSFSIYKELVDIKELSNIVIDVENDSFNFIYLLLFVLFVLLLIGSYNKRKKTKINSYKNGNKTFENQNISIETANNLAVSSSILPSNSNVKFDDVSGIDEVKEELFEIVDFLKNPNRYKKLNIKLPKGVLIVGPPGVGKTMVAKAVAGEANVPFFYQSGASFVHIYVGMGAKRVRELFAHAKSNAPSIIFIDEIDAVGKARGNLRNDEREATLNQLLTEMDGFEDNSGVIVIAATNKIDMIDEALLRSGRFDRRIFVSLPDLHGRMKILEGYLKDKKYNLDIENVAKMTVGFSGAALATLVNEAAINSLKRAAKEISIDDFLAVRDKVILGKKRLLNFSDKEKEIQATYQSAKALCAYWFEVDFDNISLVGDFTKEIDKELESKTELLSKIKVLLAGVAISRIKYSENFSNSGDDILRARNIAKEMVEHYAMGDKILPFASDIEVILNEALNEVSTFLEGMQKPLEIIKDILLEKEFLSKAKIKEIMSENF